MNQSEKIVMLTKETHCEFVDIANHDIVLLTLPHRATTCHCRFWTSYHLQCPHLLLLHKGFRENLCSQRWLQLSGLGTSVGHERDNSDEIIANGSVSLCSFNEDDHAETSAFTKKSIRQWCSRGVPNKVPSDGLHLVLCNTFSSEMGTLDSNNNVIEVTVLGKGGKELQGWEKAYLPVREVREWLMKYCSMIHRKKHVLSRLSIRVLNQQILQREHTRYQCGRDF